MRFVEGIALLLAIVTFVHCSADDDGKSLIGRPDGHEQTRPPLIGRPDGHEPTQSPLIGRPDGHELAADDDGKSLIGRPDGHEPTRPPLIGRPDGHELADVSDEKDDEGPVAYYEDDIGTDGEDTSEDADDDYFDGDADTDSDGLFSGPSDAFDTSDDTADDDDDINDDDDDDDRIAPDDDKPLVRCKRPMCLIYCENGFQTDSTGCPICHCLDEPKSSPQPLIGRPDGHERSDPCAGRAICRMFCEFGFKTDADGCPVCSCLEDPCEAMHCEEGFTCEAQPCADRHSCTELAARCIEKAVHRMCPEPMCANYCEYGYKNNAEGCMTCSCAEPALCGGVTCGDGQVCRNKTLGDNTVVRTCTVKTLCEVEREKPLGLGAKKPVCEADGSFKPLQCNERAGECWCVDGMGKEIDGTRTTVIIEEHKPKCVRNITVSMHIRMALVIRHDVDIHQLGSLNSTIVDHVSSWLLIGREYIKVVKTSTSDEDDVTSIDDEEDETDDDNYRVPVDEDEDGDPSLMIIELVVFHDGVSDLPSASSYMQRRMHEGHCHIQVGDGTLDPDASSVQVEHKFAYEPELPQPSNLYYGDERSHRYPMMLRLGVCVAAALMVVLLVALIFTVFIRRHRLHVYHFRHQKLDTQSVSSEKDLLSNENEYTQDPMVVVDEKSAIEKEPIA